MIQQIITAIADIVQVTHLTTTISIAFGMWCLVLFAVLIDLWDGVHTAKVLHRTIRSHKLRITMNKLGEYWRVMLMGFIVDLVGVLFPWYNLPFALKYSQVRQMGMMEPSITAAYYRLMRQC